MNLLRCCRDSLHAAVKKLNGPLVIGLEIPCRHCECYMRYDGETGWSGHDHVGDYIVRESDPIATAAREKGYERILGRERNR